MKVIKNYFLSRDLEAKTVDEYGSTNKQPLKDVEYRMKRCYGAVVLAFERTRVEHGVSRPGAKSEKELKDLRLPTVWNQIEAAMAYTRGLPLLVLVEHGLHDEGMLESRYDWRVKWVNLQDPIVSDPEFLGMFEDWRRSVFDRRDTPSDESRHLVNPYHRYATDGRGDNPASDPRKWLLGFVAGAHDRSWHRAALSGGTLQGPLPSADPTEPGHHRDRS